MERGVGAISGARMRESEKRDEADGGYLRHTLRVHGTWTWGINRDKYGTEPKNAETWMNKGKYGTLLRKKISGSKVV